MYKLYDKGSTKKISQSRTDIVFNESISTYQILVEVRQIYIWKAIFQILLVYSNCFALLIQAHIERLFYPLLSEWIQRTLLHLLCQQIGLAQCKLNVKCLSMTLSCVTSELGTRGYLNFLFRMENVVLLPAIIKLENLTGGRFLICLA